MKKITVEIDEQGNMTIVGVSLQPFEIIGIAEYLRVTALKNILKDEKYSTYRNWLTTKHFLSESEIENINKIKRKKSPI